MSTMTLEEMRRRLVDISAEEFGDEHETCAIGQLHHILTGKRSFGFNGNVYPEDVAMVVAEWNDNLHPENRKALAMMLPLPEAFPALTPARAIKLALWVGEQALPYYAGLGREALEQAVAFARRAAAGETFTKEEARMTLEAVDKVYRSAALGQQNRVNGLIFNMTHVMVSLVHSESWGAFVGAALRDMVRIARHAGIDWRPWMEVYLRFRCQQ